MDVDVCNAPSDVDTVAFIPFIAPPTDLPPISPPPAIAPPPSFPRARIVSVPREGPFLTSSTALLQRAK